MTGKGVASDQPNADEQSATFHRCSLAYLLRCPYQHLGFSNGGVFMAAKPKFGFALEYVADIDAAKRFYVDVMGLEVERAAPGFVQFKDHFAIASDESMDGSSNLELYWLVDDAEEAFKALPGSVEVSLPLGEKPFGKVFGVKDPAGQPRYVVEFGQKRPSKPIQ